MFWSRTKSVIAVMSLALIGACKPAETEAPESPGKSTAETGKRCARKAGRKDCPKTTEELEKAVTLTAQERRFEKAAATPDNPNLIGYEIYGKGDAEVRFAVSAFRGKTDSEIAKYPKFSWLDVTYHNVDGNFVFVHEDNYRYYWGPPTALVDAWNERCPSTKYEKGLGFYGESWYWGGVGSFGFHGYATDRKVPRAEMPREEQRRCLRKSKTRPHEVNPPPQTCSSDYSCLDGKVCQKEADAQRGVCVKKKPRKDDSSTTEGEPTRGAETAQAQVEGSAAN